MQRSEVADPIAEMTAQSPPLEEDARATKPPAESSTMGRMVLKTFAVEISIAGRVEADNGARTRSGEPGQRP